MTRGILLILSLWIVCGCVSKHSGNDPVYPEVEVDLKRLYRIDFAEAEQYFP